MRCQWGYPPDDESATAARSDALAALARAGLDGGLADDVQLAVSELAANAIRHAATDFTVSCEIGTERVRVEVFDADTRPPALLAAPPDATSGRGLWIVAAVAARWGYETAQRDGTSGKTVWAEFDRGAGSGRP